MKQDKISILAAALCLMYSADAYAFGGEDVLTGRPWHHLDITARALQGHTPYGDPGFNDAAANTIAWHADNIDSYLYNPYFWARGGSDRLTAALVGHAGLSKLHFDDTFSSRGIRDNWERYATGTLIGLYWASLQGDHGDLDAGLNILGVSFHAVQDFYSHSNWVDEPARRCETYFQSPIEMRENYALDTGAYALPISGSAHEHGAYSLPCSALRGEVMDEVLDPICTGLSPFQNTSICEEWRLCRGALEVELSLGSQKTNAVYLNPPGIALDTSWLSRVQAPLRGIVGPDGEFMPGLDGPYQTVEQCLEAINASDPESTCEQDADFVFANAKDLAIRGTIEWAEYLEHAMYNMSPRQADFWDRLNTHNSSEIARERQFEDLAQLPYQFLSAGPYPVANPSNSERSFRQTSAGWYLRLEIETGFGQFAGTDSDIEAIVRLEDGSTFAPVLLDYLDTQDRDGRVTNALLVYDDFESAAKDAYVIGPFPKRPTSVAFRNNGAQIGDLVDAVIDSFVESLDTGMTSGRRALMEVFAGGADYVGFDKVAIDYDELTGMFANQRRGQAIERKLNIAGGDEGRHDVVYRIQPHPTLLSEEEASAGWHAFEVKLHRLDTIAESAVDIASTDDEIFVLFHVAALNGDIEQSHTFLSPIVPNVDGGERHVFERRTGSSVNVKVPPQGLVLISTQVFESDLENQYDREQLMIKFETGYDEATRAPMGRVLKEFGRLIAEDWTPRRFSAFGFLRAPLPYAGQLATNQNLSEVVAGDTTRFFDLDWRSAQHLLIDDLEINSWESDPIGAELMAGLWHAERYDCGSETVEYQEIAITETGGQLVARVSGDSACAGDDAITWQAGPDALGLDFVGKLNLALEMSESQGGTGAQGRVPICGQFAAEDEAGFFESNGAGTFDPRSFQFDDTPPARPIVVGDDLNRTSGLLDSLDNLDPVEDVDVPSVRFCGQSDNNPDSAAHFTEYASFDDHFYFEAFLPRSADPQQAAVRVASSILLLELPLQEVAAYPGLYRSDIFAGDDLRIASKGGARSVYGEVLDLVAFLELTATGPLLPLPALGDPDELALPGTIPWSEFGTPQATTRAIRLELAHCGLIREIDAPPEVVPISLTRHDPRR